MIQKKKLSIITRKSKSYEEFCIREVTEAYNKYFLLDLHELLSLFTIKLTETSQMVQVFEINQYIKKGVLKVIPLRKWNTI